MLPLNISALVVWVILWKVHYVTSLWHTRLLNALWRNAAEKALSSLKQSVNAFATRGMVSRFKITATDELLAASGVMLVLGANVA